MCHFLCLLGFVNAMFTSSFFIGSLFTVEGIDSGTAGFSLNFAYVSSLFQIVFSCLC